MPCLKPSSLVAGLLTLECVSRHVESGRQRWLALASTMAFTLSLTALKDHHRTQTLLIEELSDKDQRLTAENAERRRTEARLASLAARFRVTVNKKPRMESIGFRFS